MSSFLTQVQLFHVCCSHFSLSLLLTFSSLSSELGVRALGYFAAGLTNKQLVFIQHRKNVMLSEAKKSSDLVVSNLSL